MSNYTRTQLIHVGVSFVYQIIKSLKKHTILVVRLGCGRSARLVMRLMVW